MTAGDGWAARSQADAAIVQRRELIRREFRREAAKEDKRDKISKKRKKLREKVDKAYRKFEEKLAKENARFDEKQSKIMRKDRRG